MGMGMAGRELDSETHTAKLEAVNPSPQVGISHNTLPKECMDSDEIKRRRRRARKRNEG